MCHMFDSLEQLVSLDITNFNTENVYDMAYMFNQCEKLSIKGLNNLDTSKVTDMSYMFYYMRNMNNLI